MNVTQIKKEMGAIQCIQCRGTQLDRVKDRVKQALELDLMIHTIRRVAFSAEAVKAINAEIDFVNGAKSVAEIENRRRWQTQMRTYRRWSMY